MSPTGFLYGMSYKGDVDEMRKGMALLLFLVTGLTVNSYGKECGGVGYTGKEDGFCLKCHSSGCPIVHPLSCKVEETDCIKLPSRFPLKDGRMACTTCHDMASKNRYFLRSRKPIKKRFDFCFQCHNPECYRKFNPHEAIGKDLPWQEKKKACIYCHGVGARLEAYKACVGCHTETPHVGAPEHMLASEDKVKKLTEGKKGVFEISSMKELKPKISLEELKGRKAKVILVKGRIECITCHNPHPQIAYEAEALSGDWAKVVLGDIEYKLKKLELSLNRFSVNKEAVKLMSRPVEAGKLCTVCHSINSLK